MEGLELVERVLDALALVVQSGGLALLIDHDLGFFNVAETLREHVDVAVDALVEGDLRQDQLVADVRLPLVDNIRLVHVAYDDIVSLLFDFDESVHLILVCLVDVEKVVVRNETLKAVVFVLLLAGKNDRHFMLIADHLDGHVHLLLSAHCLHHAAETHAIFLFLVLASRSHPEIVIVVKLLHFFLVECIGLATLEVLRGLTLLIRLISVVERRWLDHGTLRLLSFVLWGFFISVLRLVVGLGAWIERRKRHLCLGRLRGTH